MASLENLIANIIKKADKRFFFEDYSRQAAAVIQVLDKRGYVIVPKAPSDAMIEAGDNAIASGKVKPTELVADVYAGMIEAGKHKPKKKRK